MAYVNNGNIMFKEQLCATMYGLLQHIQQCGFVVFNNSESLSVMTPLPPEKQCWTFTFMEFV